MLGTILMYKYQGPDGWNDRYIGNINDRYIGNIGDIKKPVTLDRFTYLLTYLIT
jgi:hypothetical protein